MFNSEITITMRILKSKKHAKMKNKMNKTMKFLSMAVLALVGTVMTGCSNDDIMDIEQPGNDNVERLTIVANLDGSTTRAINSDAEKTYAPGEKIAVVYKNTSGNTVKAESDALTDGDITGSGKSAKFTVTLVNPEKTENVTYIYPAAMAKDDGSVNYDALYNEQDGSRKKLASNFDYCTYTGAWNGVKLPAATLENQLVVCKYVIKNNEEDITSKATAMTISDGANVYTINCGYVDEGIYVAIKPITSANIKYTVITNDGKVWTKSVSGKTYAAGDWFPLGLRMTLDTDMIPGLFSVSASKKVYFAKGNLQYTKSTSTWSFMDHQYSTVETNGEVGTNYANKNVVSLFGWGTSNQTITNYGEAFRPWSTVATGAFYGPSGNYNLTGTYANGDWGVNMGSGWRTLTKDEWLYLFGMTANNYDKEGHARYRKYFRATVNGVIGIVVLPDDISGISDIPEVSSRGKTSTFDGKTYTTDAWATLEAAGCVFLPAAGSRAGTSVRGVNSYGYYWSSTAASDNSAYEVIIGSEVRPLESTGRDVGCLVRLVRKVE